MNSQQRKKGILWLLRNILAKRSEEAAGYNQIQRFFGSQNMWHRFIDEYHLNDDSIGIIDIGCGTAEILAFLPAGVQYLGIDQNEAYIQACRRKYPKQEFFCGSWEEFQSSQKSDVDISLVLCLGLLHHLSDQEAKTLLASLIEYLPPNGRLLSLDGSKEEDSSRWESFFYWVDRGAFIRNRTNYLRLFPSEPRHQLHRNWLRVPYTYLVCEWRK